MLTDNTHALIKRITTQNRVFYHGSRGTILEPIQAISRQTADLGAGFYMACDSLQAKRLAVYDVSPVSYTLSIDFTDMPDGGVLVLDALDATYAALHNRRSYHTFNDSPLDKAIAAKTEGFDFLISPIVDDHANIAVKAFAEDALTNEGLSAFLSCDLHRMQVVAKTQAACKRISIVSKQVIYDEEADDIMKYNDKMRICAHAQLREIQREYKGKGKLLTELIRESKTS